MMAYDRVKIYNEAKKLVVDKGLIFMTEVISLLPISNATFYLYFPESSEELDTLKELIGSNKTSLKIKIRSKMLKEGKSADNIALYKLAGTKEERDILNGVDSSSNEVRPEQKITIEYVQSNNER